MSKVRYSKDGVVYPSVTEIISFALSKDILLQRNYLEWLKVTGIDEAEKSKKKAGARGTKVHLVIHKISCNLPTPKKYNQLKENISLYMTGKELIMSEKPLFTFRTFAGTPDLVYKNIVTGEVVLADFKTSVPKRWHELQLGGYQILLEDNGIFPTKADIINVRDSSLVTVASRAYKPGFLACFDIYSWWHKV